jgi:nucleotide-binding universal stress UspA family protein
MGRARRRSLMYKKILVPLDGSELCANALEPAEELAKLVGAEIILFHVVPLATIYTEKEGSFCDFCDIETGESPARKIVDFAKRNLISLIVMTTHGRSGFSHMLLGSVAEKVAREGSEFSSVLLERCKKC